MAEIKIEKNKSIWIWVLLLVGIAAVLFYFLSFNDENPEMEETRESEVSTNQLGERENLESVGAFVVFVEAENNKMTLDHEYANEALLKLIEATNEIANEVDYNIEADIDQVKKYAESITVDPNKHTHANSIRKASDMITRILQNIQQAKYPRLSNEVLQLRNASSSINPDVLTLDQKDAVKSFFGSAADLLNKMNN